jgi:quercetin dioxygenase-like cupin family protein
LSSKLAEARSALFCHPPEERLQPSDGPRTLIAQASKNVPSSAPPGMMVAMTGDRSIDAMWSGPGEGEQRWFLGTLATLRVPGEFVDGRFALIEFLFPRFASPPRHTHPQDESYVVLDGRLTIESGEQRFTLEVGGTAVVPMGVAHTFRVDSDTARVLVLSTPAGLERLIRDGSVRAAAGTLPPADAPRPTPDELSRIFETHGQINCGPPLGPDD